MSLVTDALVLSPMVDVTDAAFRSLARDFGADVTCSEMVAAAGLVHGNRDSWDLVRPWPAEAPYGVQVMGGDPEEVAQAVRLVADRVPAAFIDINLGCPSPNVLRSCAGGFLLRDPVLVGKVVAAAVDAAADTRARPLITVKMRLGMDDAHRTFLAVGQEAEAAGAAWATLHGRTVAQGYAGQADWGAIGRLVDQLAIPVVGNGDLREPDDVVRMRDQTGCAGFFIARAAMRDPTVFTRMRAALDGQAAPEAPDLAARLASFLTYLDRAEQVGIAHVAAGRRQAMRFCAGAPGAKALRQRFHDVPDLAALRAVAQDAIRSCGA